ncbi:MAG: four helix bundle protein [Acidimicrobiia bacterium]|nr:four helix bundle protein [Acidimicrobiia bacterium]NNK91724.1 four helix bundle protein [Acidimicrobiia bacterium]
MGDFEKLTVAVKARHLALGVYRVTEAFPKQERYGLTSQLRRAAVSVGANLAEGSGRYTDQDFRRFVGIARGSASELEFLLGIAKGLGLNDVDALNGLIRDTREVNRMLSGLRRALTAGS